MTQSEKWDTGREVLGLSVKEELWGLLVRCFALSPAGHDETSSPSCGWQTSFPYRDFRNVAPVSSSLHLFRREVSNYSFFLLCVIYLPTPSFHTAFKIIHLSLFLNNSVLNFFSFDLENLRLLFFQTSFSSNDFFKFY